MTKDDFRRKGFLKLFKSILALVALIERGLLSSQISQGRGKAAISIDKATIEVGEA